MIATRLLAAATLVGSLLAPFASAQTVVPAGPFDNIELRGGGHVMLRHGAVQRVTILQGSTQYTKISVRDGHDLRIDACNDECPTHYDLEIEIVTPSIGAVAISGGGRIESAAGFPAQRAITAAVEGGGTIDIRAIAADSATAAVTGGGKIEISAKARLTAAVEGGGSIRYAGSPSVTTAISGGGSVRPEDS